ncbi:MAG: SDR family NAD(P)-dependent oxidoreductase [Ignavibacteriae bacterium]|nr:SDR family NAD(P)-dependent oxidoreductase [Ignavibacteriota bacterium]MCB9217441.1 SDR family NAD(P)-dependent oxidoreductase [Ignavibacteria bacterium]
MIVNKSALITGASSGIGAAIARTLVEAGVNVALMARREEVLREVGSTLSDQSRLLILPGDVTVESDVRDAINQTVSKFGSLDILVNNAGYGVFKPVDEMTLEEFRGMIDVNLQGVFLATKYGLEQMYKQGKGGDIVTISSIAGKNGFAGGGGYCASKFGVMGLMESVFHEARSRNVRVITITPGSVDTPFFHDVGMTPPNREHILQPEDVAVTVLGALVLPERALIRELDIRPANPKRG